MKIVYMGTPGFAISPLKAILSNGYEVVGVVTAPDKPAGRGKKLMASPVKQFALEKDLKILQPEKLKDPGFIETLKSLKPDIQVVVAFRMVPGLVWEIPPKGTFNLHASLLPQYRGAAPINWAIINGEKETGLSTFFIDEKIDTGEILLQERISIGSNENAGELHDRMMDLGAELVIKTLKGIEENTLFPVPQSKFISSDSEIKSAPKIFKEDCQINWNSDSITLHNFIRGLSPYPAATTVLKTEKEEINSKIYSARPLTEEHQLPPGSILSDEKSYLKVAVKSGFMEINEIQIAGKRRMKIDDFLRGFQDISKSRFL